MSEYVYRVYRVYEGEPKRESYAADLETAKEVARNMVVLESPPEWVERGHWAWELKDYGDYGEGCYIDKHVLKGDSGE